MARGRNCLLLGYTARSVTRLPPTALLARVLKAGVDSLQQQADAGELEAESLLDQFSCLDVGPPAQLHSQEMTTLRKMYFGFREKDEPALATLFQKLNLPLPDQDSSRRKAKYKTDGQDKDGHA